MLNNTELKYYDSQVLRLPKDKRTEYHAQVDRLIATLSAALKDKTKIKMQKNRARDRNWRSQFLTPELGRL